MTSQIVLITQGRDRHDVLQPDEEGQVLVCCIRYSYSMVATSLLVARRQVGWQVGLQDQEGFTGRVEELVEGRKV